MQWGFSAEEGTANVLSNTRFPGKETIWINLNFSHSHNYRQSQARWYMVVLAVLRVYQANLLT